MIRYCIPFLTLLFLFSCKEEEPKEKFKNKTAIAELNEVHGMVTYTVYLYKDGTYYIPSTRQIHYAEGKYKINGDIIQFWNTGGSKKLESKYVITGKDSEVLPVNSNGSILYFKWYDEEHNN